MRFIAKTMIAVTLVVATTALAEVEPSADLAAASLEELLTTKVTSVSKRQQSVADSAAAVTVVTSEDIRRSGAASIPDALRTVVGLNVAQINGGNWAISSRG